MRPEVSAIAGRLSLRPPQRESLEILDRITEIVPPKDRMAVEDALTIIGGEFPGVTDFERDFPSLCFAIATGVGKTRLMGAFISYLHQAHGIDNFFVLAPNLTIYNKLIADFMPGTPKYVFKGIAAFATNPPEIITGDNYEQRAGTLFDELVRCKVNIFNISKINSEVRGGRSPRIKRLSEYIGQSYFEYLAERPDLVLLMDESHRYRASAGVRAINELKPVLGLELTATPYVQAGQNGVPFRNVIFDYPLGRALADGFVKEPAVVTRKDFDPRGMSAGEIERLKLEDGIRLHEQARVELETYARENNVPIVKPFVLVIARDTAHAAELQALIKDDSFFDGRYRDRVIQVDSSATGSAEDEMVERLLRVEHADEPTEIVIHVNMLKEGWDVTNLYTIIPLRAANARVLVEQSIGRGLRLPYGKRTGVAAVDRLSIVAHDRFQEIVDDSSRPDSPIHLTQLVLDGSELAERPRTVVSQSVLDSMLGVTPPDVRSGTEVSGAGTKPLFDTPAEQEVARVTARVVERFARNPVEVPTVEYLARPEIQGRILHEVKAEYQPLQPSLPGVSAPDIEAIVAKTVEVVIEHTFNIPRVSVIPSGEVKSGFQPFTLDTSAFRYATPSDELVAQSLVTGHQTLVGAATNGAREERLEDYVVSGLIDFDDVSYDHNAELLYELASQTVAHFRGYLSGEDTAKVLRVHQKPIAQHVHAQMQAHYWEEAAGYEVVVSHGFLPLKPSAYAVTGNAVDFRAAPSQPSAAARNLYTGFKRCLYTVQKFDVEAERRMAVVLDRDSLRWFRPAKGQFQLYYRWGGDHLEYVPDFVAEGTERNYVVEPKRASDMQDPEVRAKRDAAVEWCKHASEHARRCGGKPWAYLLIPHDRIAENVTLAGLAKEFAAR